jgi:hypothetical protein
VTGSFREAITIYYVTAETGAWTAPLSSTKDVNIFYAFSPWSGSTNFNSKKIERQLFEELLFWKNVVE